MATHIRQEPSVMRGLGEAAKLVKTVVAVFVVVAALMILGGIVMVFNNPDGFFLIAFGLLFGGFPLFVYAKIRIPTGKKAIAMESMELNTPGHSRSKTSYVLVDETLDAAQVEDIKDRWLQEHWQRREDWRIGRLVEEDLRCSPFLNVAIGVWSVITLGMLSVAWFFDPFFWLVGGMFLLVTFALVAQRIRVRLRQKKFGASEFLMTPCPAALGDRVQGRILTGVEVSQSKPGAFTLECRCLHRYRSRPTGSSDSQKSEQRREHLHWSQVHQLTGRSSARRIGALEVVVDIALPEDQPATTLSSEQDGIIWKLCLTAKLPGLDYRSEFVVPVLSRDTIAALVK